MQRQKDTFQLGSSNTDENDAHPGSVSPWSEWPEFSQPKAFGGGPGEEFSGQSLGPRGGYHTITKPSTAHHVSSHYCQTRMGTR